MVVINSCVHSQAHKQLKRTVFDGFFFSARFLFLSLSLSRSLARLLAFALCLYLRVRCFFPLILSEREFGWFIIVQCVFGIKVEEKKRYGGNVYIPLYGIAMLALTKFTILFQSKRYEYTLAQVDAC